MKSRALLALAVFFVSSLSAQISVESIRQTSYDYACVDADDNVLSKHQRLDKASAACVTRKLNDSVGEYSVAGGRWRIDITGAQAGLVSIEPVTLTGITAGNSVSEYFDGTEDSIPPPGTEVCLNCGLYTDLPQSFILEDTKPNKFDNYKIIRTKHADRGSTAAGTVEFTPDVATYYCVAHSDDIATKGAWLLTLNNTAHDIVVGASGFGQDIMSLYCGIGAKDVEISLGGNTTDGNTDNVMYIVLFAHAAFAADEIVAPAADGNYEFVTTTSTIAENVTTADVCTLKRLNGNNSAVSADITDLATGSCTDGGTDYDTLSDKTVSWADSIDGAVADGMDIVAKDVSADCTIDLGITNAVGGISSSGSNQTCTVTINHVTAGVPRAFPGCEGFGCESKGGRLAGSTVCIVTNTNSSGSGSLPGCLLDTGPRFVTFNVAGQISMSETNIKAVNSNVTVLGQTAPGDGIMIRPDAATDNGRALRFSDCSGNQALAFHDGVFQHIRFRFFPGSGGSGSNQGQDAWIMCSGTHHVVMDHTEVLWTSDEAFNIWGVNIHDITISHSIIGESGLAQLYGPLVNTFPGGFSYNWSVHHNLVIHNAARSFKVSVATHSTSGSNRGLEFINNVMYNTGNQNHHQTGLGFMSTGHFSRFDVIGQYTKNGPNYVSHPVKFLTHNPGVCSSWTNVWQAYLTGSTWRNSNGTAATLNDEADNYNMVAHFSPTSTVASCPGNVVERVARIDQPVHPVTVETFAVAYTNVVVNENVGAQPLDSHAQRLVDDPEDGGGHTQSQIPTPFGSGSVSFTGTPYTDTDSDGIPDSCETTIGTNPSVFENHATLDTDGDGYMNIEDFAHTKTGDNTCTG